MLTAHIIVMLLCTHYSSSPPHSSTSQPICNSLTFIFKKIIIFKYCFEITITQQLHFVHGLILKVLKKSINQYHAYGLCEYSSLLSQGVCTQGLHVFPFKSNVMMLMSLEGWLRTYQGLMH